MEGKNNVKRVLKILRDKKIAEFYCSPYKRSVDTIYKAAKKQINIVIGTHGTAISSIFHYFNSDYTCDLFLRIIIWMPYIIELDFKDKKLVNTVEYLYNQKKFEGK